MYPQLHLASKSLRIRRLPDAPLDRLGLFKAIGGRAEGPVGGVVATYGFEAATVAERLAAMPSGEAAEDLRAALTLIEPALDLV